MKRRIRSFRIYPDNGEVYFECRIYPSKKSFEKARPDCVGCAGVCTGIDQLFIGKDGSEKLGPHIGTVYIKQKRCRNSIVTHELAHAAVRYFRWRQDYGFKINYARTEDDSVSDREECFCRVLSNLVIQFWNQYHRGKEKCFHPFDWNPVELKRSHKPILNIRTKPTITI